MNKFMSFLSKHKFAAASVGTTFTAVASACPALAADGVGYIQSSWVTDLLPNITADVGTMVPVGIGIMALFIGIGLIPRIVYKFMG